MAITGNVYDNSGWYKPTKYDNRPGSAWAIGKNSRPDNYTKSELKNHYDLAYNDPVAKMRPTAALPDDADKKCYDWVMNVRSLKGRWQLHNPNGLNAHMNGLDPYDWVDTPKIKSTSKTREYNADIESQDFDVAYQAALLAQKVTESAAPRSAGVTAPSDTLSLDNVNRNSIIQDQFKALAAAGAAKALTFSTILSLGRDDEKKDEEEQGKANKSFAV